MIEPHEWRARGGETSGEWCMAGRLDDDNWVTGVTNIVPPQPEKADRAYLIILAGDGLGEMHQLIGDEMVIGRAGRAQVILRDDGVSRLVVSLDSAKADAILPELDRWASLIRQLGS